MRRLLIFREMLNVVGDSYLTLVNEVLLATQYESLRQYNALNYLDKGMMRFGRRYEWGKSLPDGHQASVRTHARWVLVRTRPDTRH